MAAYAIGRRRYFSTYIGYTYSDDFSRTKYPFLRKRNQCLAEGFPWRPFEVRPQPREMQSAPRAKPATRHEVGNFPAPAKSKARRAGGTPALPLLREAV